jgi:hypothetical protein
MLIKLLISSLLQKKCVKLGRLLKESGGLGVEMKRMSSIIPARYLILTTPIPLR